MLTRKTNGNPINRLRAEMDQLFDTFFGNAEVPNPFALRTWPALNIWEDARNVYAEAELPGLDMSDIEVLVSGKELTVRGEQPEKLGQEVCCHRRERYFGKFNRIVQLPVEINAEKVNAELRHGVLTITLPKADDVLPRKIEVKCLTK